MLRTLWTAILCLGGFSMALVAQTVTQSDGDFELYSNGIVKCTNASVGDTGTLGGVTYTKRSTEEITGGSLSQSQLEQSCISGVTSLANLFRVGHSSAVYPGLTPDISTWDVSSVTSMFSMFRSAFFAPDIDDWDVSNVTTMASLFRSNGADFSGLSLSNWDVSKVTQMNHMFLATNFNGDISSWDVSAVFTFGSMFNNNTTFNQDISSWEVSNAENMDNMLDDTPLNVDLSGWCVSQFSVAENGFDNNTSLSEANKPNWGSCPTSRRKLEGNAGWRLISIPYDEPSLLDISDDVAIQGVTGGNDADNDPNVYTYDDTGAFEVPSSLSSALPNGTGLAIYVFDNDVNGSSSLPLDLDAQGTLITSDVSLNINSGSANLYTLVGNPFTTNFETDSIRAVGGEIQANVAFWSDEQGSYTTVDRTTAGHIIPSWQAFWIETSDANVSSIILPVGGKKQRRRANAYFSKVVADSSTDSFWDDLSGSKKRFGDLHFELSSEHTTDKAIRVSFREDARVQKDRYDFGKLTPLSPQYAILSFVGNEQYRSVEALPYDLEEEVILPMQLQNVSSDTEFILQWRGLESLPEAYELRLYDAELDQLIPLHATDEYRFNTSVATKQRSQARLALQNPAVEWKDKQGQSRFQLLISPSAVASQWDHTESFELYPNYPNPFNPKTTLSYRLERSQKVVLEVYDIAGRQVATLVNAQQNAGYHRVSFDASALASGVYVSRLRVDGMEKIQKMLLVK